MKTIDPVSDPEEIRAAQAVEEASREQPLRPPQPQALYVAPGGSAGARAPQQGATPTPAGVQAGVYPTPGRLDMNQAAALEVIKRPKPAPPIGLYVIVGLVFLSALSTFLGPRSVTSVIIAGATVSLGLGLLWRYEIARVVFVALQVVSLILGTQGLFALLGASSVVGHSLLSGRVMLLALMRLGLSLAMVTYLSLPGVKSLFG